MPTPRTDLALEAAVSALQTHAEGVEQRQFLSHSFEIDEIRITFPAAAEAVGKPVGRYLTMDVTRWRDQGADAFQNCVAALGACLDLLLKDKQTSGEALIVGLGNRLVTPDAVGPRCTDHVIVTRHLLRHDPEQFAGFFPVAALATGVLAATGVESGEVVAAVAEQIRPGFVIAVDALAARSAQRLCNTIQLSDTGIVPGSGVGNARAALNERTLGVPVLAVGVPTVVDGGSITGDESLNGMFVTPKDVDALVGDLAKVIGYGINAALQKDMTVGEMEFYLG